MIEAIFAGDGSGSFTPWSQAAGELPVSAGPSGRSETEDEGLHEGVHRCKVYSPSGGRSSLAKLFVTTDFMVVVVIIQPALPKVLYLLAVRPQASSGRPVD